MGLALFTLRLATWRYRPERSILEFYDDVRGSLRNWRHCKQQSELAAMLVCRNIWRVYMEFIWSFVDFSSQFAVGIVSYARTTIIHGYFIAITFAGSLGRYLNTRPSGLVFKQLPRDPANVDAWKTMGNRVINSLFECFDCSYREIIHSCSKVCL